MSKLDETLNRLKAKGQVAHEAQRQNRRQVWERIQREAPDIAQFLLDINQVFGKPEKVGVWIGEERIL